MGECWHQKDNQYAPSMKMECDYLYGWNKKVTQAKISPKMMNPRDVAGNAEEEEKKRIIIVQACDSFDICLILTVKNLNKSSFWFVQEKMKAGQGGEGLGRDLLGA